MQHQQAKIASNSVEQVYFAPCSASQFFMVALLPIFNEKTSACKLLAEQCHTPQIAAKPGIKFQDSPRRSKGLVVKPMESPGAMHHRASE